MPELPDPTPWGERFCPGCAAPLKQAVAEATDDVADAAFESMGAATGQERDFFAEFRRRFNDDPTFREQVVGDSNHGESSLSSHTQALISGELFSRPTVPIEHFDYPDDYDIEANIGAEYKEAEDRRFLIAGGKKNHLIKPFNDAVFLKNVSVDWISLKGHGKPADTSDVPQQILEDIES